MGRFISLINRNLVVHTHGYTCLNSMHSGTVEIIRAILNPGKDTYRSIIIEDLSEGRWPTKNEINMKSSPKKN